MSPDSLGSSEAWGEQYGATREALEIMRVRELAAMTDEEALLKMMSLRSCDEPPHQPRGWSGLVEQQAIFHGLPRVKPPVS